MSFDLKIAGRHYPSTVLASQASWAISASRAARSSPSARPTARPPRPSIATGKVVSPGFVDVHTHYDAQILWDRMLSISPWHGVTTTVIGKLRASALRLLAPHIGKLILQTLEKVEGMSLDALQEGPG